MQLEENPDQEKLTKQFKQKLLRQGTAISGKKISQGVDKSKQQEKIMDDYLDRVQTPEKVSFNVTLPNMKTNEDLSGMVYQNSYDSFVKKNMAIIQNKQQEFQIKKSLRKAAQLSV